MTSDAGRPVDFLGTVELLKLPNCSPWKKWKAPGSKEWTNDIGDQSSGLSKSEMVDKGNSADRKPESLTDSEDDGDSGPVKESEGQPRS